ncbi:hypothetical protein TRVA0_003S03708 [Trichomonascus vanleenenianus]|uniref:uncharacterized protein n=1 Tax=Trichomonascus vanleenenianus TaxID=2268995 RepID=UPI003EC9D87E
MTTRARRACIPCKSRKIKCSATQPRCQQCEVLNLRCEYPVVLAKPKRKIRRGEVIIQYKEDGYASVPGRIGLQGAHISVLSNAIATSTAPGIGPRMGLNNAPYDTEFLLRAQEDYARKIYPMCPVISPAELRDMISRIYIDKDDAAVVYALLALTVGNSQGSAASNQVARLVDLALENRGVLRPNYKIDVRGIMTSLAISSCLTSWQHSEMAWVYLREAVTMGTVLKLEDVGRFASWPLSERTRYQRLYWVLYIHERFMAIHSYHPVLLSPLSILPEEDPALPKEVNVGFMQIIKLFRLVDSNFMKAYLGNESEIDKKWIEERETELSNPDPAVESLPEIQQADLIITQQWLRMLIWQMAMSRFWLSTGISEGCMSLLLPVQIARKLRGLISRCSKESIEVHGIGILQKLFELSSAIADVIILIPAKSLKESAERIDDYMWIANFLLSQSQFSKDQKDLLKEKLRRVHSVMPESPPSGAQTPEEAPHDDPWLTLSEPFVSETTLGNNRPMIPSITHLSETSQGLLNELDLSLTK